MAVPDGAGWWALAIDPGAPAPPSPPPADARSDRSWRGLAVGLALGIAVVLGVVAILLATNSDDQPPVSQPATTFGSGTAPEPSTAVTTVEAGTAPPSSARNPTPLPIVASDDRRVVVLDQGGSAAPRTLFDLGASTSADEAPPLLGGVSLSGDASQVYFDVVGTPLTGLIRRVPLAGGAAEQIGEGVAPALSPDGSMLAFIQSPEPDQPASLVLRPVAGGAERRIDLGDGTCGNVAWSPDRKQIAVDICSGGEPVTLALVDAATGGVRQLAPPDGVTWSVPAYKPDGTLTLVEQREADAFVVALKPDFSGVATTVLRRTSTTISTIDWSAGGDLLVCDVDGIVVAAIGGGQPQQITTGYTSAAW
ncbi:MAG: hypothetical protein WKF86_07440 [Acidimicrobiales bacterium]